MNKILVGALQACETQEQVEDTFNRFDTDNLEDRVTCLNACMGDPLTFFAGGEPDIQTKYATVLSMFLTGEWKLNELYKKIA
jgi:hypothetical protein